VSDSFNWLKGSHAFTFGGDYTHLTNWLTDEVNVPSMTLGYQTNFDPAEGMFNTTNFPGSTAGDRNNAKALYALLTGRVSSISGTGYLNEAGTEYVYNGPITGREWQDDYSFFAQDVWRWKPTVTVTGGVRYQYTLPMNPANSTFTTISLTDACGASGIGQGASADGVKDRFCNMFQPGTFGNPTAPLPSYVLYTKDNKGYNTDFNNLGPIVGIAWRPNVQDGWMRKILGDPELATINAASRAASCAPASISS
jgi:outer membrane receptor protein involved in Fe transport